MVNRLLSQLIIIITHDCNLRCEYCLIEKQKKTISADHAKKTIRLFFSLNKKTTEPLVIKFFGGEPLLKFSLVKMLIEYVERRYPRQKVLFYLSTNGILLHNKGVFEYLRSKKNIRIFLSIDGAQEAMLLNRTPMTKTMFNNIVGLRKVSSMPNITVNMVIAPNQAGAFYKNFLYLLRVGFKYFNFLPAYCIKWNKTQIASLSQNFKKIATYYRGSEGSGQQTRNEEVLSRIPFFNEGLVVDCDGKVYFTNMIFSRMYSKLKKQLMVGDIRTLSVTNVCNAARAYAHFDILGLFRKHTQPAIFQSIMRVDMILTKFVKNISRTQ